MVLCFLMEYLVFSAVLAAKANSFLEYNVVLSGTLVSQRSDNSSAAH